MTLTLRLLQPDDPAVAPLIAALSDELRRVAGNDGSASFAVEDFYAERAVFLAAFEGEEAVGCGGLRPLDARVAEVKRMYAKYPGRGIGGAVLRALEEAARGMGYAALWLETRRVNQAAARFYLARGYRERANYGRYVGRTEAICFEKELTR